MFFNPLLAVDTLDGQYRKPGWAGDQFFDARALELRFVSFLMHHTNCAAFIHQKIIYIVIEAKKL